MRIVPICLLLLVFVTGCTASNVVTIGVSLPLSGDSANIGESLQNGIEMALADMGDTQLEYRVVYEDDKILAASAATAVQKLINIDGADAVISVSSGTGNAISPIAQENEVLHCAIASDAAVAQGEYNFIHWTPPNKEAELLRTELEEREFSRVAVLAMQHQGVVAVVDAVRDELAGSEVEIVGEEFVLPEETDFRTSINKLEAYAPDIYLIMLFSPQLELATKQLGELGITTDITSIETFDFTEDPSLYEGRWYVTGGDPSEEWVARYQEQHPGVSFFSSGNGYDCINLLVYAFEEAAADGEFSQAEVAEVFAGITDFQGELGSLTVNAEGIVQSPATTKVYIDGVPTRI